MSAIEYAGLSKAKLGRTFSIAGFTPAALPFRIHLYKNNLTPGSGTVLGDFVEAVFPGYTAQNLLGWSVPVLTGGRWITAATVAIFTRAAGVSADDHVYGMYVTDQTDAVLLKAELDPAAPIILATAGDTYSVVVQDSQKSEF